MKRKGIVLFLVIVLLLSLNSSLNLQEQKRILGFVSGNDYLKGSESSSGNYVIGLVDMFWVFFFYNFPELYQDICEKMENMTGEQIKKIFEKYLKEHPEELHLACAGIFLQAMLELCLID